MTLRLSAPRSLGNAIESHDNGFNLVRLVCALLVVVFHAWQLAPLEAGPDPLTRTLAPLTDLGSLAVGVFFIISGIFVTQSWMRDPHGLRFAARRIARIVPGLLVCSLLTVLVAVPFFSAEGWRGLLGAAPWLYVLDNSAVHWLVYNIPAEGLRIPGVLGGIDLNGPLWTLYWEGRMYVMVLVVGMAAVVPMRNWLRGAAVVLLLAANLWPQVLSGYIWELRMWSLFLTGMFLYTIAPSARIGPLHALCALALLGLNWTRNAALLGAGPTWFGIALLAGALALWAGTTRRTVLPHIRRNDYSYGIYIYHWPVLLILRAALPPLAPPALLAATLAVLVPLAVFSWHWVEAPALRWMRRLLRPRRHA